MIVVYERERERERESAFSIVWYVLCTHSSPKMFCIVKEREYIEDNVKDTNK
mgnify:FL=1